MIGLSDIQAALTRIRGDIRFSACTHSDTFSGLTNNSIFLKLDNQQRTGAFKERGALNKLLTLTSDERARGVIAASAGNHAQGVAYHAGRHGVHSRIVMPLPTPLTKVSATRAYGAEVVLEGANYDEAYARALEQSQQDSLVLIHAFDDDAVIAGQGSLGLEILQQHSDIEAIVVPIGGGGLIGGIACAVKETSPAVKIFGVQPSRIPSMKAAVAEGKPVTLTAAKTIADGIAVRRAGDRTHPLVQIRRRHRHSRRGRNRQRDSSSSGARENARRRRWSRGNSGCAEQEIAARRQESCSPGRRREHRCHFALPHHRAWLGERRTPGPSPRSPARLSRRAASPDRNLGRSSCEHRRDRL